ncbi:MAG: ribokinase [Rubrivivax sp.]
MSQVLVAGSANLDFVVRAPRIPAPGETVLGHELRTYPGGKGANQAVACARAGGAPTRMLLGLGDDGAAAVLERSLQGAGVQLQVRRIDGVATGSAFITVDDQGANAITVAPGANAALVAADLPPLHDTRVLLMQLETPLAAVTAWAQAAQAAGVRAMLNAAPAQVLPDALRQALSLLVLNEGELALLAGHEGGLDAQLARLGVPEVVVTLGERGCLAHTRQGRIQQPAFAVDVVDTTAAGDTFCGVLAAALARDSGWPQALREAAAAAALACTRPGAQSSIPTREQLLAFLSAEPRSLT